MADDIPHDGGSLGMEGDPEHVPLPPRVRPFDPETYHPEGDSHSIRGYGATSAREWYMDLPIGVRQIVDEAGFGLFCIGLSRLIRWRDTTNSFHFSTIGDMTMTPYDFAMLTGIEVYAYFPTLAPESKVEMPPVVPYSHRYDGRFTICRSHNSPRQRCLRVSGSSLLDLGVLPVTGLYLRDRSHATSAIHAGYRESLLLGGIRAHGGRAAGALSTSKARVPRGRAKEMAPVRQSFGYPELPTELTGWRYTREAYRIPIKPLVVAAAVAVAGPSAPPPAAGRERETSARS
ncbi:hypothetical protein CsSME_00026409 [Camellia sinensis var. sinensis]